MITKCHAAVWIYTVHVHVPAYLVVTTYSYNARSLTDKMKPISTYMFDKANKQANRLLTSCRQVNVHVVLQWFCFQKL